MLSDQQKTDVRRFCGYPAYGAAPSGNVGWRFFTQYGLLEYRMANLSVAEIAVVLTYLASLTQLEAAVPLSGANLDTDEAAAWRHNPREVQDRLRLFDGWRRRLCAFLGIAVGEGLDQAGIRFVV